MQLEAAISTEREIIVTIPTIDASYARLDHRVTGLETTVKGIELNIGDLGKKVGRLPPRTWPVLLTGTGILIGLVGVIIRQLQTSGNSGAIKCRVSNRTITGAKSSARPRT